jgi:hypothetical protein
MNEIIGFAELDIDVPDLSDVTAYLDKPWQPHYNTEGYEGDWEVLTLRSPGGGTDSIFAELMDKTEFADTVLMQNLPSVKKLCEALQCPLMSVRLLNLKAGAIIKQHRDVELAFENGEARLHFPVITNNKVEFYVNDTRVDMQVGQCWYINANLPHRVANHGTTDRIHLVIDCKVNGWLKGVFARSEKTTFKQEKQPGETRQIIEALRSQQTETANKLADELELKLLSENTNGE